MSEPLEIWGMLGRLASAAIAGAVLGLEREWKGKPAGLRTHMMVSLGAALFMTAAVQFLYVTGADRESLEIDPLRVLQGIVGGIGFLGAGAIVQGRGSVEGITTAASVWLAAAIGISCGMGFYELAAAGGGLALLILVALHPVSRILGSEREEPPDSRSSPQSDE